MRRPTFFLAVLLAAGLAGCLSGGCGRGTGDAASGLDPIPVFQVTALHGKPPGDDGRKIVRLDAEDNLAASPNGGRQNGSATPLSAWTPVDQLPSVAVGPGLVVCEPVAAGAGAGVADFGAGCGRWLHFSVAGLPQMGQTPLWSSLERAEAEMGRTDLRLGLPDVRRLAGILGATHMALGQITGPAAHCTLSYQLYAVPGGTPVGTALQATGTQAQVLSQLPRLAQRMSALLGLSPSPLPPAIRATPTEIGLLGRLAWYPDQNLPAAQIHQLQVMATRLPLAGLFLVNTTEDLTGPQWDAAARALLAQEPSNGLVWAQLGYSSPGMVALSQPQLARNLQAFPQNYPFAAAQTWVQRRLQNANAERRAAEQTVQNAPRNPDAWLTLGSTVSEEGDRVRQCRLAADLSAQEWQFLNSVYPQWDYAVSRSAQLDPLYGKAWDRVAQAATFDGHPRQADQALWKDIALNPNDPGSYEWGLQMYQGKWGGSSRKLAQTAQTLSSLPYPKVEQGLYAVKLLRDNEGEPGQFGAERQALLARLLARTRQAIAHNPGDAQAHYDQAYALSLAGRTGQSAAEYRNVVLLRPTDAQALFDLAQEYDQRNALAPAITAYRQGLCLDPTSAVAHFGLGWDLKEQRQLRLAETEMRKAVQAAPYYAEAHAGLATVLAGEHRGKEATAEMQQAVRLNPSLIPAVGELCSLLDEQGRYAESLAAGRHAIQIKPDDNGTMDEMADDYLHLKQWDRSIEMSQAALQVDASDALAHENLGEAYVGQGRKGDARDEWNKVLAMDHGDVAPVARKMLAEYP